MPTLKMRATSALSALRLAGGVKPLGAGGIMVSRGARRVGVAGAVAIGVGAPEPMVTEDGGALDGED
jgi:hypothetical protein